MSSISWTRSASLRASCERASASSSHHSGTMLRALPPCDRADVRGRLLVEPAEPQVGDRACGGRDRGASLLGDHPRVRRPAVEADEHRALVRRAHDHLADRRRLVVDEAELGLERRVVEGARAEQADLLLRREEELDTRVRPALRRRSVARPRSSRRRPTCCRRRGSSRRRSARCRPRRPRARAAPAAARCRGARRGRSACRVAAAGQAAEQVADRRVDLRARVVLSTRGRGAARR